MFAISKSVTIFAAFFSVLLSLAIGVSSAQADDREIVQALHGGGLWDDDAHITKGSLQSLAGLGHIWFRLGATQQYYPVLHTAFWFEHRLWGGDPLGYHLLNVGLHILAALSGVTSGFETLLLKKGSAPHRNIGNLFTVSMALMGLSGAYLASLK